MRRNPFPAADSTQAFGGRGLDIDLVRRNVQVGCNVGSHQRDMGRHAGRLRDNGDIQVTDRKLLFF